MNTSTGATVTIDGRDTGLNPSDGYDPNPDDSDISSMKVIGTGAGRTEIHDLPAGWHVNAEQWDWKGRSGIRYEVWKAPQGPAYDGPRLNRTMGDHEGPHRNGRALPMGEKRRTGIVGVPSEVLFAFSLTMVFCRGLFSFGV